MTHTPGPWIIDHQRIGPPGEPVALLCDVAAPHAATVVDWPRATDAAATDDTENEANARLIASAPTLLAALTAALYCLENHHVNCEWETWPDLEAEESESCAEFAEQYGTGYDRLTCFDHDKLREWTKLIHTSDDQIPWSQAEAAIDEATGKEEWRTMYTYTKLPQGLRDGMRRYVEDGRVPGHFLTAVLKNNLREAVMRADPANLNELPNIIRWMHWELPVEAHGSAEDVGKWVAYRKGASA